MPPSGYIVFTISPALYIDIVYCGQAWCVLMENSHSDYLTLTQRVRADDVRLARRPTPSS